MGLCARDLMQFDNGLVRFGLPEGWEAEHDDEGNILASHPGDPDVWLQVELGGVRKPGETIEAASFLRGCYAIEIESQGATLVAIDDRTALVTRTIDVDHAGVSYCIRYYHFARNQSWDNVQLAQFGLVFPADRRESPSIVALAGSIEAAVRGATFLRWSEDASS